MYVRYNYIYVLFIFICDALICVSVCVYYLITIAAIWYVKSEAHWWRDRQLALTLKDSFSILNCFSLNIYVYKFLSALSWFRFSRFISFICTNYSHFAYTHFKSIELYKYMIYIKSEMHLPFYQFPQTLVDKMKIKSNKKLTETK